MALLLCLSASAQELKVTGSRKAVRTSGDVLVFVTPVAGRLPWESSGPARLLLGAHSIP